MTPTHPAKGLIIAAPASGSGKTVLTLALLRHLKRSGIAVASAKVGPDYIDPAFHAAATGTTCYNLDPWAMRPSILQDLIGRLSEKTNFLVTEGAMGLFDGATATEGSTADLAELTGWPVILIADVASQAASAAALIQGFAQHRKSVAVAGVIFNRVGSPRHEMVLREAMATSLPELPIIGFIRRNPALVLPDRHLGLVQAAEHPALENFLENAADVVAGGLDFNALKNIAGLSKLTGGTGKKPPILPLGQRIAIARDEAFAFSYPATLEGWQAAGAELSFFSPLNNEGPNPTADGVYLPGGYPELHAEKLSQADRFLLGLKKASDRQSAIFGECGGYMVLGEALTDKEGQTHRMAGLLPLKTSLAHRRLHLGYRRAKLLDAGPLGRDSDIFRGHEFHYATIVSEQGARPLFETEDARGESLGETGLVRGRIAGSFIHLIDKEITT